MNPLVLHAFHEELGGSSALLKSSNGSASAQSTAFGEINGQEVVRQYQSVEAEYLNLTRGAGILDFSFRGRICVLGGDREKFLHGQVTNDVLKLKQGEGCYAALVNGKGRIQSDLYLYKLGEEILLDFEPGLTETIIQRLNEYIIADDVQVVDVAPHYGLLSVQGPESLATIQRTKIFGTIPAGRYEWKSQTSGSGEIYLVNNPRLNTSGFDVFIPIAEMESIARRFEAGWSGWDAFEIARIESGIPRFGIDMTEANLAPEAEIAARAISYAKGCYIGQEIIARIRTYGKVAKALRLVRLPNESSTLPLAGAKLLREGREAGYITSSTLSPKHGGKVALAYVRKECNAPGTFLQIENEGGEAEVIGVAGMS